MPAADALIIRDGAVGAPSTYTVPATGEIIPLCVTATFDGSASTGAFIPTLEVITPDGHVLARCPLQLSIAAGGSANVTWFPGVGGGTPGGETAVIGARIYSVATRSVNSSTGTDMVFDTVDFDTNGMANLAGNNKILTAQTPGLYLAVASITFAPNTSGIRQALIYRNGYFSIPSGRLVAPSVWNASVEASVNTTCFVITLVDLVPGDFLSCGIYQTSGGSLNTSAGNTNQPWVNYLAATLVGFRAT